MDTTTTVSQRVIQLIYTAIDEVNQTLAPDRQVEKKLSTVLFGEGSTLESLGLVSLIVGVEQHVNDEVGVSITLVDEKAMSQRNSPFRTVETLAQYTTELVESATHA